MTLSDRPLLEKSRSTLSECVGRSTGDNPFSPTREYLLVPVWSQNKLPMLWFAHPVLYRSS